MKLPLPNLLKSIYVVAGLAATLTFSSAAHAQAPKEIGLDYAYWAPESVIIKNKGWLEETFKPQGTTIKWVFSRGSNNSLEFINSGATQFAVSAAISALVSRANGQPIKAIYNYLWSETSALVVSKDSNIKTPADIKGKKVAATKGTNPYFFLLRSLDANQLKVSDIEIVHLQHPDGRTALEQGRVDVWAGLDPHLAAAEAAGARFVYRNKAFRDANFLNTTERFLKEHPDAVRDVLKTYERARVWILANPKEAAAILAAETKLPVDVVSLQLGRYDFTDPVPGAAHRDAVGSIIPLLLQEGILKPGADAQKALGSLIEPALALEVTAKR
ncbi:aliphatic sulfonate ABC transporter substrate-binding protein [Ottowia thiooxydans]|uniref:aliphatic sulfonate ABC transporter substrate-binding protein n=1 Tax=Ottowia thiooxydans TaxID=219182 RepID=UPI00040843EA|nr:aliphatic sulfonate ABC transporter substrate-binding protein [Ottowia thiooxydans]